MTEPSPIQRGPSQNPIFPLTEGEGGANFQDEAKETNSSWLVRLLDWLFS